MPKHIHTEKYKRKMSNLKSLWWTNSSEKTKNKMKKKISIWSKQYHKEHKLLGASHPAWKGGKYIDSRGGYVYIYAPNHPLAKRNGQGGGGYYLEHRLVMEKKLGRILTQNEEVHHKNGIKTDNRLVNLELVIKHQHFGKTQCPYCGKKFKVK